MDARRVRRHQHGFSLLELVVAISLIAILAAALLERLRFYQEAAEKANVEYTISALKSALRVQMAAMMVEGRVQDYDQLEHQNPIDWLDEKPRNFSFGVPAVVAACKGCWSYDAASRTLTYWPARGEYLQPDSGGQKRIRLRVNTLRDIASNDVDARGGKPIMRVVLEVVEPYSWLL
ncbi:hypothetical protein TSA66_18020 [Noviherbaspirillum autotrophicum]|uniref:Prepilin-type N-terminal cleavage/methylation domain-containing protein n=2 Tax=Noviherbaspirillum autotrophicum TaxID=709839 RepID=A0A0C1Y5J5_9BURK|nr:hypothetical protein TSA66_18020 [Noviherbaspirillum autotrophicum]